MTIIKVGKKFRLKIYNGKCPICGCEISCNQKEIYSFSNKNYYSTCPNEYCTNEDQIEVFQKSKYKHDY